MIATWTRRPQCRTIKASITATKLRSIWIQTQVAISATQTCARGWWSWRSSARLLTSGSGWSPQARSDRPVRLPLQCRSRREWCSPLQQTQPGRSLLISVTTMTQKHLTNGATIWRQLPKMTKIRLLWRWRVKGSSQIWKIQWICWSQITRRRSLETNRTPWLQRIRLRW